MSALRDIRNQLKPEVALAPQTIASDTTTVGAIIDTADADSGVMLTINAEWTDGLFTPLIEQSSDPAFGSDVSDVADENLIGDVETGQEADAAISADGIKNLGVVNQPGRFLRLSMVSTGTTSGAIISSEWHLKKEVSKISN